MPKRPAGRLGDSVKKLAPLANAVTDEKRYIETIIETMTRYHGCRIAMAWLI